MKVIIALLRDLIGMFCEDGSLAIAILVTVALAAVLSFAIQVPPFVTGGVLVGGCVAVLLENILRAYRDG
jgi:xanthine/uracil permease